MAAKVPAARYGTVEVRAGVGDVADARAAVAEAFRSEWERVVAYLIGVTGSWDLAEDCAQDTRAKALERWPREGIPASPAGWPKTVTRKPGLLRLAAGRGGRGQAPGAGDDSAAR